jgi:hypothetical protein
VSRPSSRLLTEADTTAITPGCFRERELSRGSLTRRLPWTTTVLSPSRIEPGRETLVRGLEAGVPWAGTRSRSPSLLTPQARHRDRTEPGLRHRGLIAATGIRPHGRRASRVECGDRCRYPESASATRSLRRPLAGSSSAAVSIGTGDAPLKGTNTGTWATRQRLRDAERELAQQAEACYGRMGAGWQAAAATRAGASVTPGRIVQAGTSAGAMRRPRRSAARSRPFARAAGHARGSSW